MPDIKTDDGCIIHVEVQGPQNSPVRWAPICTSEKVPHYEVARGRMTLANP